MSVSKDEYGKMADKASPPSPVLKNCCFAFLVGGAICCVGQAFSDLYSKVAGFSEDDASVLSSVTLVFLSALFTGLGLYQKLARIAGAGTLVPITGFANSIVAPAMEHKREGLVMGVGAELFSLAGPVLVYGITSSVIVGIIAWLTTL